MGLHEVVERDADDRRGYAAEHDLAPQGPGAAAPLGALRRGERVQLMEEQHADGEDGAQLDDDLEHVPELLGHVQLDELVHQDEMAGRGDGQPLGDALDDAQERGFQQLDDVHGTRLS